MTDQFPESVDLNGVDYFLVAIDRSTKKNNAIGNICRVMVNIDASLCIKELTDKVNGLNVFKWFARLRLKKRLPFLLPKWKTLNSYDAFSITEHHVDNQEVVPDSIWDRSIDIFSEAPVQIDLIRRPDNKTSIMFSWHHTLMDAHGAEIILKLISGNIYESDSLLYIDEKRKKNPFFQTLKSAKSAKDYIISLAKKPCAEIIERGIDYNKGSRFRVIGFSKKESDKILINAKAHGARLGTSPFFLVATARGIKETLLKKDTAQSAFWVPVPLDNRKRGALGPAISNQVSFLFYRLEFDKLNTVSDAIKSVTSQMMEQVRMNIHTSYLNTMEVFKRIPCSFYANLIKEPKASFFFSIVGGFINDINTFSGHQVEDIIHYPPNAYPPGLTTVFMKYNDIIKVVIGHYEDSINESEIDAYVISLKENLLRDV